MRTIALSSAAFLTVALAGGYAAAQPWNDVDGIKGAAQVIQTYYQQNASEGTCSALNMNGITHSQVAKKTGNQVVLKVSYFYNKTGSSGDCTGFGARTFTLDVSKDGAPAVVAMSGDLLR